MYPQQPPSSGSRNVLAMIVVALIAGVLALGALTAGAVVIWVLLSRSGDGAEASSRSDDPLRPEIQLQLSEACGARFDVPTLAVTRQQTQLSVGANDGSESMGMLMIDPRGFRPGNTVTLEASQCFGMSLRIVLYSPGSAQQFTNCTDSVTGAIRLDAFDAERGIMDVTFQDVTLRDSSGDALCHVRGRIRTHGLTWGAQ